MSSNVEDMFCNKRRCTKEPLIESGDPERMDKTSALGDVQKQHYTSHKVHISHKIGPVIFLGLSSDMLLAPLQGSEKIFSISKLLLDLKVLVSSCRSSSSNEPRQKSKGAFFHSQVPSSLTTT